MKITLLKTSKQNRQHLQSVPMETMIQTVMSNQVADDVEDLRQFVKWAESWKEYDRMYRLPFVYPSVEIEKDKEEDSKVKIHIQIMVVREMKDIIIWKIKMNIKIDLQIIYFLTFLT